MEKFKQNDKVIWNSGFGYDLGYFIGIDNNQFNNYIISMETGIIQGKSSLEMQEIIPYNDENLSKMIDKYGYELVF
jgi:hypothetical protein